MDKITLEDLLNIPGIKRENDHELKFKDIKFFMTSNLECQIGSSSRSINTKSGRVLYYLLTHFGENVPKDELENYSGSKNVSSLIQNISKDLSQSRMLRLYGGTSSIRYRVDYIK